MNQLFETDYVRQLTNTLSTDGKKMSNRTGISTLNSYGINFVFQQSSSHSDEVRLMMVNGKRVYPRMALTELLWMLQGRTDVQWLRDHGVTYWDEWVQEDGTIGKAYGYQFRNFNGLDQLKQLFDSFTNNLFSRRHIISLWNVNDLPEMALAPCMFEYNVTFQLDTDDNGNTVLIHNLHGHIRSNDAFLGAPYNFIFCSWFNWFINGYFKVNHEWFKKKYGIDKVKCGKIFYTADNFHIYDNHIDAVQEYIDSFFANTDDYMTQCYHTVECPLDMTMSTVNAPLSLDAYLCYVLEMYESRQIKVKKHFDGSYTPPVIKAPIAV